MIFDPPLAEAVLRRRYKRFLADLELPAGGILTVHVP
ncbi:MAG: DNA/RNA nuclease SfsA, partial [Acidobacteriota bacterium]|nr:DNA/RNA nuclease SfsA [Acidobacteriota bacterium]